MRQSDGMAASGTAADLGGVVLWDSRALRQIIRDGFGPVATSTNVCFPQLMEAILQPHYAMRIRTACSRMPLLLYPKTFHCACSGWLRPATSVAHAIIW